ncbi:MULTISPECIES: DUF6090 family protein [Alteromonadaceae]|uniref:DUF6090 family protein n=1 Tax=Alteromonadaceae TaxID=72275 RepID=UPI003103D0CA
MLLRRISKHVKAQDWFAVAIDFFIVVAGILIAFQITSWNEARKDSKRELQIITRLHSDFTMLENDTVEAIEFIKSNTPIVEEFEQQILNYPNGADIELMQRFFETAFSLPRPEGQSETYQQLVTNGDMSVLNNETLRAKLVYHASLTDYFIHANQANREWTRPYLVSLVRLSSLIDVLPMDEAISSSGSRADLIVAISLYKGAFEGQLAIFEAHRESFDNLKNILIEESKK